MRTHTAWCFLGAKTQTLADLERQGTANGHPLAMQKPVRIARRFFQSVAKRMAKIQKRALALFGLVALDNCGFHLDRTGDGFQNHRAIIARQGGAMGFKIVKKRLIPQKPVFDDLAVACQQITLGQSVQHPNIRQHQRGLVKGPDQVFAMGRIDAGLAPNRGVNLRQQRGRHLHKSHPAPQHGAGKPHQIAHHPAAKGNHNIPAFDFFGQKPFNRAREFWPSFGAFSGG